MKKLLLILLLIIPSLASSQSKYLEKGSSGGMISIGGQFTENHNSKTLITGASIGINGTFDIGFAYGTDSRYKAYGLNMNFYLVKQETPDGVSIGITGQYEKSKLSSYYSSGNWNDARALGVFLESNISKNYPIGLIPALTLQYAYANSDGYVITGFSFAIFNNKQSNYMIEFAHYLTEFNDFSTITFSFLFY